MKNTSSRHLDQLTGLRYFAALLVFVSHLKWDNSSLIVKSLAESGYVGVSFFFVLSGFVLSYSYQEKIIRGEISFKRYLFLRLARLTPLHWATALPFIIFAIYSDNLNPITSLLNLIYMQSWLPHSTAYFSLNAPSWSLSNEMFFYFCFFFLTSMTLKRLIGLTSGLILFIILCAFFVTIYLDGSKFLGSDRTIAHWLFYIFPGFRILEFISGMIIYRLWRSGHSVNAIWLIPAYIFLIVSMYFAHQIPQAFRFSLYFLPIICLFLFVHLSEEGLLIKMLKSKFMVLLGNASFALYLIHRPLIHILYILVDKLNIGDFGFFVMSLLIISFLSVLTYLYYEKWAEKKLKKVALRI